MPCSCTALNLRRLQGVITRSHTLAEDAVVLSLDAKLAFDTVEWQYMWEVLRKVGVGPQFIQWVQVLYKNPLAQVKVIGVVSLVFTLERGIRQGCPLSPLLFALTLEPIAAWIR